MPYPALLPLLAQSVATRRQLAWTMATDYAGNPPAGSLSLLATSPSFRIDDDRSVVLVAAHAQAQASPTGAGGTEWGTGIALDGGAGIYTRMGGGYSPNSGDLRNPFSGNLVHMYAPGGLSRGLHTVSLGVWPLSSQLTCYLRGASNSNREFATVEVWEIKQPAASGSQSGRWLSALAFYGSADYWAPAGLGAGWTTALDTTFVVKQAASLVLILPRVNVFTTIGSTNALQGCRLLVDGTPYQIGGCWSTPDGGEGGDKCLAAGGGPIALSGLAPGTHAITIQFGTTANMSVYWRSASYPYVEFVDLYVWEILP